MILNFFFAVLLSLETFGAVMTGSDVLEATGFGELRGKRVGLLANPSSVNGRGEHILDVLRRAKGVKLVALFAAEHGWDGIIGAGVEFKDGKDARTGLPIYSLYGPGPTRKPTPKMLAGLDVLVYDIQDTGCRSYTFIATMGMAMEACAQAGVVFLVLDRPNPLGGLRVEGPRLSDDFKRQKSLVSRWDIPYVYGLTSGELALMIAGQHWIEGKPSVGVIPLRGWNRSMTWKETGLRWVPTSPNIPKPESPLHYVSIGMLGEIGGVNIGNKLGMPFECVAAPWLDAARLASEMNHKGLRGVQFDPFKTNGPNSLLQGVRIRFTDPPRAPLLALTFHFLDAIQSVGGRDLFKEASAQKSLDMFDRVNGTTDTRRMLEKRASARVIVNSWKKGEAEHREKRLQYLLYPYTDDTRPKPRS